MSYRVYRHPIYKAAATGGGCAGAISTDELRELYDHMSQLLTATQTAIAINEKAIADGGSLTATERTFYAPVAGSLLSRPLVYVRLAWLSANPGVIFDRNSCVHVLQLKAIYDATLPPNSWQTDPLAAKMVSCLA